MSERCSSRLTAVVLGGRDASTWALPDLPTSTVAQPAQRMSLRSLTSLFACTVHTPVAAHHGPAAWRQGRLEPRHGRRGGGRHRGAGVVGPGGLGMERSRGRG